MGDPIQPLAWDSEHFGLAVARVAEPVDAARVEAAADAADAAGIRCLTALVPAADVETIGAAEATGFRCYDVRVELDREVREEIGGEGVARVEKSALGELLPIAASSFLDSRFYVDRNFPRTAVEQLYVAWLRRGFGGDGRCVLATPARNGFVVCHIGQPGGTGTVELIAVAEGVRGQGLGTRLVRGAEAAFGGAGMERARVVTQGANIAAQRLYQSEGYRTRDISLWLHRWAFS